MQLENKAASDFQKENICTFKKLNCNQNNFNIQGHINSNSNFPNISNGHTVQKATDLKIILNLNAITIAWEVGLYTLAFSARTAQHHLSYSHFTNVNQLMLLLEASR